MNPMTGREVLIYINSKELKNIYIKWQVYQCDIIIIVVHWLESVSVSVSTRQT